MLAPVSLTASKKPEVSTSRVIGMAAPRVCWVRTIDSVAASKVASTPASDAVILAMTSAIVSEAFTSMRVWLITKLPAVTCWPGSKPAPPLPAMSNRPLMLTVDPTLAKTSTWN